MSLYIVSPDDILVAAKELGKSIERAAIIRSGVLSASDLLEFWRRLAKEDDDD